MTDICETRSRILAEARRRFARSGFYGTSMDSIAKKTGLSKGALYWHFENKAALFKAVLEKEMEEILKRFIPGPEAAIEDPLDFFRSKGEEYLDILWEDEELHLIWVHLFLEAHRGEDEGLQLSRLVRRNLVATYRELMPIVSKSFPGFSQKKTGIRLEEMIQIVDFFFEGLLFNLGPIINLEQSKKYWRFFINRFIGGGDRYA